MKIANIFGWEVHRFNSSHFDPPEIDGKLYIYKGIDNVPYFESCLYLHIDGSEEHLIKDINTGWYEDAKGVFTALANNLGEVVNDELGYPYVFHMFRIKDWSIGGATINDKIMYYASTGHVPRESYLNKEGELEPSATWFDDLESVLVALSKNLERAD